MAYDWSNSTETTSIHWIWVDDGPEIDIIQEEVKLFSGAAILSIEKSKCSGWDIQVMVECATHLWLLGKYVGIRTKELHNKDY